MSPLIVALVAYACMSALVATLGCQHQIQNRPPLPVAWIILLVVWPVVAFIFGALLLCTREVDAVFGLGSYRRPA